MGMLKEMSLANGRSYMLTPEEAKIIMSAMASQEKGSVFVKRLEMAVNIASVMSVSDPETVPYFWGNKMNASKTRVLVDGEWRDYAGTEDQIEYRLKSDPSVIVDKNKLVIKK